MNAITYKRGKIEREVVQVVKGDFQGADAGYLYQMVFRTETKAYNIVIYFTNNGLRYDLISSLEDYYQQITVYLSFEQEPSIVYFLKTGADEKNINTLCIWQDNYTDKWKDLVTKEQRQTKILKHHETKSIEDCMKIAETKKSWSEDMLVNISKQLSQMKKQFN